MRVVIRLLVVALLATPLVACNGDPGAQEDLPNILIIMTDDQPATLMDPLPKTRELFEEGGVIFTQAFATTPQCCPSRASILSGKYAHNHGVLSNDGGQGEKLDPDSTVVRYLQDKGYITGIYGKYLNLWPEGVDPPHFDRFSILTGGGGHYADGTWNELGESKVIDTYSTTYVEEEGLSFLRDREGAEPPWALFLWVSAPHTPTTPERRYEDARTAPLPEDASRWEADISDKPAFVQQRQANRVGTENNYEAQQRTLMSVDDMVESVFNELIRQDIADDTLAFFMSDNGYMFGEHGMRGKSVPYVPAARIPMYMRFPAEVDGGRVEESMVANLDVPATIMDAVTGKIPKSMEGRSLLRLLDGGEPRTRLLLEHFGITRKDIPPWASIITEEWQYTEHYDESGRTSSREYYDLIVDPFQLDNLLAPGFAPPTRAHLKRLAKQLVTYRFCTGDTCP